MLLLLYIPCTYAILLRVLIVSKFVRPMRFLNILHTRNVRRAQGGINQTKEKIAEVIFIQVHLLRGESHSRRILTQMPHNNIPTGSGTKRPRNVYLLTQDSHRVLSLVSSPSFPKGNSRKYDFDTEATNLVGRSSPSSVQSG